LNRSGLNERQIKAIKFIKDRGEISRKEYVALAGISPRSAHLDLKDMVKKKLINPAGKGRSVKYKLHNERLHIARFARLLHD
jgi:ATP-dependent DNA helicase RecG